MYLFISISLLKRDIYKKTDNVTCELYHLLQLLSAGAVKD